MQEQAGSLGEGCATSSRDTFKPDALGRAGKDCVKRIIHYIAEENKENAVSDTEKQRT